VEELKTHEGQDLYRGLRGNRQHLRAYLARLEDAEVHAYDVSKEQRAPSPSEGWRISGLRISQRGFMRLPTRGRFPVVISELWPESTHTRAAIEQTAHIFGADSAVAPCKTSVGNEGFSRSTFLVIRARPFLRPRD